VFTGSVVILIIALAFVRRIGARTVSQLLSVGCIWPVLTLIFEMDWAVSLWATPGKGSHLITISALAFFAATSGANARRTIPTERRPPSSYDSPTYCVVRGGQ